MANGLVQDALDQKTAELLARIAAAAPPRPPTQGLLAVGSGGQSQAGTADDEEDDDTAQTGTADDAVAQTGTADDAAAQTQPDDLTQAGLQVPQGLLPAPVIQGAAMPPTAGPQATTTVPTGQQAVIQSEPPRSFLSKFFGTNPRTGTTFADRLLGASMGLQGNLSEEGKFLNTIQQRTLNQAILAQKIRAQAAQQAAIRSAIVPGPDGKPTLDARAALVNLVQANSPFSPVPSADIKTYAGLTPQGAVTRQNQAITTNPIGGGITFGGNLPMSVAEQQKQQELAEANRAALANEAQARINSGISARNADTEAKNANTQEQAQRLAVRRYAGDLALPAIETDAEYNQFTGGQFVDGQGNTRFKPYKKGYAPPPMTAPNLTGPSINPFQNSGQ